jgi:hypothetical protein
MYVLILHFYLFIMSLLMIACADTENMVSTNTQLNLNGDQTIIHFNSLDQDTNAYLFDRFIPTQTQDAQVQMPKNDAQVQADFSHPNPNLCTSHCDCPNGLACINGSCMLSVNDSYCCTRNPCPEGNACQNANGSMDTCHPSNGACQSACDCSAGQSCVDGRCILGDQLLFCCSKSAFDCPSGEICEDENRQMGRCASQNTCTSACDCRDGFSCINGACTLGSEILVCCLKSDCISGLSCEMPDGTRSTCQ